jgi:hypothetical protein
MTMQFLGFAPPPTQGLNPLSFLGDFAQGLAIGQEKLRFRDDLNALQNLAPRPSFPGGGMGVVEQPAGPFVPQSQRMQALIGQQLAAAQAPLTQFQRESLLNQRIGAQAELARAQATGRLPAKEQRLRSILSKPEGMRTPQEQQELDIAMGVRGRELTPLEREQAEANLAKTLKETQIVGEPAPQTPEQRALTIAQTRKALAEAQASGQLQPSDKARLALDVRKSFQADKRTKDFRELSRSAKGIAAAVKRAGESGVRGPSDQVIGTMFQKMLDPDSVVRESEFARIVLGQSWLNRLRGKVDAAVEGGIGLTPQERQEVLHLTEVLLHEAQKEFNSTYDEFNTIADQLGLDKKVLFGGAKKIEVPEAASASSGNREIDEGVESARQQIGSVSPVRTRQAFTPVTDATEPELANAITRAQRRLGANATREQILQMAGRLVQAGRSGRNPARRENVPRNMAFPPLFDPNAPLRF